MVFVYVPNLVWSLRPSSQSYLDILELKKSVVSSEYHFTCPGVDLALLTMANHSILSHGTFGMWGALMAGGETVMPLSHIETKEYQEIDKAQLPGWIFIWCLNLFIWWTTFCDFYGSNFGEYVWRVILSGFLQIIEFFFAW